MPKTLVYFIESGQHIKIGLTTDVNKRLNTLQTGSPHPLRVVDTIEFENKKMAQLFERAFHDSFHSKRAEGEWFYITDLDVYNLIYDDYEGKDFLANNDNVWEDVYKPVVPPNWDHIDDVTKDRYDEILSLMMRNVVLRPFDIYTKGKDMTYDEIKFAIHRLKKRNKPSLFIRTSHIRDYVGSYELKQARNYWLKSGAFKIQDGKQGKDQPETITVKLNGNAVRLTEFSDRVIKKYGLTKLLEEN